VILVLLAALQAGAAPADATPAPVRDPRACAALVDRAPEAAITAATRWADNDGGVPARQCLGQAFATAGRFAEAATTFENAAGTAALGGEGAHAAALFAQAGNAALANGEAGRARTLLDRALARTELTGELRGEVLIDRARADVQAGDNAAARRDLDEAAKLVPADPMAWLLSATLARRGGDPARAAKDIAEAQRLAPRDAAVHFEAGNVAQLAGDLGKARAEWSSAAAADPESDAGQAAALALRQSAPK
jgi:tetratricopeptide (TPR) repeat protein